MDDFNSVNRPTFSGGFAWIQMVDKWNLGIFLYSRMFVDFLQIIFLIFDQISYSVYQPEIIGDFVLKTWGFKCLKNQETLKNSLKIKWSAETKISVD